MNLRSTAFLFAVMFSMLWLFGLLLAFKKNPLDRAFVVPSLQAAKNVDIIAVTVERKPKDKEPQSFAFTKDNDIWRLTDAASNIAVKVEGFRIDDIVRQVQNARKDDEADVTSDLARFGLTTPQAVVTIKGRTKAKPPEPKLDDKDDKDKKDDKQEAAPGKEREWKFFLGNESVDKKFVYCNSSDEPQRVFAVVRSTVDSLFFEDANALRSKRLFDFTDATAKTVAIKKAAADNKPADELELSKGDDSVWRFVKPALGAADFEGPPAPKDLPPMLKLPEGGVKGLLSAIQNIRVDAEADFVAAAKDNLTKYKLEDGKELLRIQVGTSDILKKDAPKETLLIGVQEREYYYARLGNDEGVFKLKAKLLQSVLDILGAPGKLRSLDVASLDAKTVDAIVLKSGKDETKLWKPEGKPWQVQVGSAPAKKANEKAVEKLIETLQGKRQIQRFHDVSEAEAKKLDAELGLDAPAAEVSIYIGGLAKKDEKKDEKKGEKEKEKEKDKKDEKKQDDSFELKKDAKPALVLRFGKADKETVAVLRGTDSRFVVPKALFDAAAPSEGTLAFLDLTLPAVDTGEIVRLELQRGAKKLELERASGNQSGRWLVQEGKDKADQNLADDMRTQMLLKTLGGIAAKKWVKRLDPKDNLDDYGLKTPSLTATIKKLHITPGNAAHVLTAAATPEAGPLLAAAALAGIYGGKGESIVIQFGKETADKDVYAKHSGSELLFAVPAELAKMLRELDLRDKTALLLTEPTLAAGAVGSPAGLRIAGLTALAPINAGTVTSFDPAKIKEIRLAVRSSFELRELAFQRKDKTWVDQSGLKDFSLDADKVEQLAKDFAHLHADRFISLTGGAKADQKLGPRDYHAKIDLITDEKTITITVGATLDRAGHFAVATSWPDAVFLLQPSRIDAVLRGVSHFAKERAAE